MTSRPRRSIGVEMRSYAGPFQVRMAEGVQFGQISPHGGRGDTKLRLYRHHRDTPRLADELRYPLLAPLRYVRAF